MNTVSGQNGMKSPAVRFWCHLANFISGGHALSTKIIVKMETNVYPLKCNYCKLVRKGI